ncbi:MULTISPECIES: aldo/keto reductase [unclassified Salinibacterium]|uniref:aldo/keto reductase n=1 Tax=unclassified Salinibacterium TaxID=2632331 RepID=UPI001424984F|nr:MULTISPECIES: aldo/keto reductase [unclassified Salinibacterium]
MTASDSPVEPIENASIPDVATDDSHGQPGHLVPASPVMGEREIDSTGVRILPLGLDGAIFGWAAGAEDSVDVLDAFSEAGGTFISTSNHYAAGRSELMIGNWLRDQPDRDRFLIATKVGRHPDHPGLGANSIKAAVEASLERLATDRIDFLSFDGDHPETPAEESLAAAAELVAEGKVRYLSAAGYSGTRLAEVHAIAEAEGYPMFRSVVAEYSLMERDVVEKDLLPVTVPRGISLFAKTPLASGYLSGQFRTRDDLPSSPMFGQAMQYIGKRGNKVLDALEAVAAEHEQIPGRIALAWLLAKPGVIAALVRAKSREQLAEHLGAVAIQLTRQQMAQLEKAAS